MENWRNFSCICHKIELIKVATLVESVEQAQLNNISGTKCGLCNQYLKRILDEKTSLHQDDDKRRES